MSDGVQPDARPTMAHIVGVERFDLELEAWLTARQLSIRLNRLSRRLEVHRLGAILPMTDERLSEIQFTFLYAKNGKEPARDKLANALSLIGERRAYHPVIDYLDALQWDGVPRLNRWLVEYAGAANTKLNQAFGQKMLCAAVRRAKKPGCKFDHVLVLQGTQDLGKSSLIRALCHDPAWFTDQVKVGSDAKETIERASGSWLVELAELDGMGRREANAVKSFITTVSDRARPAYGRFTVDVDRQFVLFGTTNETAFLNDITGNRRWWPMPVTKCDVAGLIKVRDQLWAEAVHVEPREALWLDDDDLKVAAAAATGAAVDHGPWYDLLAAKIVHGPMKIAVADAWRLVGISSSEVNKISVPHRSALRRAMTGLGFDPETKTHWRDGEKVRAYVRGDAASARWWSPHEGGSASRQASGW